MSVFDLQKIIEPGMDNGLLPDIPRFLTRFRSAREVSDLLDLPGTGKVRPIVVSALRDGPHPFLACIRIIERPGGKGIPWREQDDPGKTGYCLARSCIIIYIIRVIHKEGP